MFCSIALLLCLCAVVAQSAEVHVKVCGVFLDTIGGDPTTVRECNGACGSTAAKECAGDEFAMFPTAISWTPTTQARWGVPPEGSGKAGFGFAGFDNNATVVEKTELPLFPCGNIAHFNSPVLTSTAARAAVLKLNFDFGNGTLYQANLELDIEETPNQMPCKVGSVRPCADILSFKNDGLFTDATVDLDWFGDGEKKYALQVVGVVDDNAPLTEFDLEWISQEQTTQAGTLVCRLIPPCPATCEDPSVTPGPVFLSDGSKICGCKNETVITEPPIDIATVTPRPTVAATKCEMVTEPAVATCQSEGCCMCKCESTENGVVEDIMFCSNSMDVADCPINSGKSTTNIRECSIDCGTPMPTPMPPTPVPQSTAAGAEPGDGTTAQGATTGAAAVSVSSALVALAMGAWAKQ